MENQNNNFEVVKTGEWIVTLLVASIPVVGLVLLFVWAFGGNTNPNKANLAKATLIWVAIICVIYLFFILAFGAALSRL